MRKFLALMLMAGLARAEGEPAGQFDYYVLSLSWSPNWCALEGDDRGSPQCDSNAGFGWVLHGLWPQYEQGWPSYCRTTERAKVVEQAFLKANPEFNPDTITITCKSSRIQEARICLNMDLSPRRCGADAIQDCRMDNALFDPLR